jgi:gluconokinase
LVLSCSALKRAYRDILRQGAPDLHFLYLQGDYDLLAARMAARTGHYMPLSLLASQLSTLEAPGTDENAQIFDVASRPEVIVAAVAAGFSFAK